MTDTEQKPATDAAAEAQAKADATAKAEADAKAKADADAAAANAGKTVADILGEGKGDEGDTRTVPEAAFLEEKKGRKQLEKRNKELEKQLEEALSSGGTKADIAADIEEIGKKHNVSSEFLRDLTTAIEAKVGGKTKKEPVEDDETKKRLSALEERDRAKRINEVFEEHYAAAMEQMPEFKAIANKSFIKKLTLDPENAKKTFKQIIEEAYGAAVPGRRTIEQTKPGGGKEPGEIDYKRAEKDTAYFKEIMADPALKKKYNEGLIGRIGNSL